MSTAHVRLEDVFTHTDDIGIVVSETFHQYPPVRKISLAHHRQAVLNSYSLQGTDNQQVSLHVELAPSYGDLTAESVKQLDEKLKVALSYTLHALADIPANQRKWKKVLSTMLQSPVLEADDDLHRSESRILPSKSRVAQLDRTQDAAVVEEVCTLLRTSHYFLSNFLQVKAWFQNLIGDEDIRQTTKIDIQKMAGIVAGKGATTRKLRHLIRHTEWDSKIQIDIGVLRFPDISNPHFKVSENSRPSHRIAQ